ncbi:hypothetical protein pdam_00003875 [Pocillopora damicornis]|uniref:Uncharacterized protein n=1 Tax=Pocillopora damicornis TaxID=46731 RepID=A0A3M6U6A5_POCDA|nr:hypothetical protein pdam_00003875 [Pocillopora damicornis]
MKHSKLPKMVRTQSPYNNPQAISDSQHLQRGPEISFSHMTSDLSKPPASPVRIVPIICRTTHTAEKNKHRSVKFVNGNHANISPLQSMVTDFNSCKARGFYRESSPVRTSVTYSIRRSEGESCERQRS